MVCGFTEVHTQAPEVDNWGSLFVDGLKLMIVGLGYAIPIFILYALIYGGIFIAALSGYYWSHGLRQGVRVGTKHWTCAAYVPG